jgi:hypothetical protein
MICKQSGSLFDPTVVEAFLKRQEEFEKLSLELGDETYVSLDYQEDYVGREGLEVVTTELGGEVV